MERNKANTIGEEQEKQRWRRGAQKSRNECKKKRKQQNKIRDIRKQVKHKWEKNSETIKTKGTNQWEKGGTDDKVMPLLLFLCEFSPEIDGPIGCASRDHPCCLFCFSASPRLAGTTRQERTAQDWRIIWRRLRRRCQNTPDRPMKCQRQWCALRRSPSERHDVPVGDGAQHRGQPPVCDPARESQGRYQGDWQEKKKKGCCSQL